MANWPATGGSAQTSKILAEAYASPLGSDTNDGLSQFTPKKFGYDAALALAANGGGTLFLEAGTAWGGPVVGQGMWIRGDGIAAPGFIQIPAAPFTVKGFATTGVQLFQSQASAGIVCGNGNGDPYPRKFPGVWICGTTFPVTFDRVVPSGNFDCPYRIGIDYDRNADGTTRELTVTNATRSSGSTVLTVTLPTGFTITSASRTSNVTSITISGSFGQLWWTNGATIKVNSTDVNFASGTYTVLSTTNQNTGIFPVTITYAETGSDVGATSNIGTMQTHAMQAGEWLDLFSSNSEFPHSMYLVTAVTDTTITVTDPYGYSPRSASANQNNIGTLSHANRRHTINSVTITGGSAGLNSTLSSGPFYDVGSSGAVATKFIDCYAQGIGDYGGAHYVPDRSAGWLLDAGNNGFGTYVVIEKSCATDGTIRVRGHSVADNLQVRTLLIDTGTGACPPALQMVNPSFFSLTDIDDLQQPDNDPAIPGTLVEGTDGHDPTKTRIGRFNDIGGGAVTLSGVYIGGITTYSGVIPAVRGQTGFWGETKLSGVSPAASRPARILGNRFTNQCLAPSGWQVNANVTVSSTDDPFGGNNATRLSASGTEAQYLMNPFQVLAGTVGYRHVVCGYVRLGTPANAATLPLIVGAYNAPTDITYLDRNGRTTNTINAGVFPGAGWQWCASYGTITSAVADPLDISMIATVTNGCTLDLYGFGCFVVSSSVSDNDFIEWINSLGPSPQYLAAGMNGTMEDQKTILHGGIGVKSSLVVSGATAASDRYVILYDEAGNALMRLMGAAP